MEIILASGSKWRKRLLKKNGIDARIHVSDFKEKTMHENPRFLALYNARGKARSVLKHYKTGIIIGVDTIGVLGKSILLKPHNRTDASRMIKFIAGKKHKVISGLCVINASSKKYKEATVTTSVTFNKIRNDELKEYLDSNHWVGKAGAYAIQGRAKRFVSKIQGDVTNVIGLPIGKLMEILKQVK